MAQERAQIVITERLASQISVLHNQCPYKDEWSGILIYEVVKGDLEKLASLEIKAHAVFPMDFGNGAYTEYESSPDMLKIFDIYPQVDPLKKDPKWFIGHIHSHHDMTTFFSGTDTSELLTNVKNLPIYLSLIVNYRCDPCAKIAVVAEAEEVVMKILRWKVKGFTKSGKNKDNNVTKHSPAYVIDCDVVFEGEEWFIDRVAEVKQLSSKKIPASYNPVGYQHDHSKSKYNSHKNYNGGSGADKYNWQTPSPKSAGMVAYNKMMGSFASLVTLGEDDGRGVSLYRIISNVNTALNREDREKYKSAFKYHFVSDWFEHVYGINSSITPVEALNSIFDFVGFHKELWVSEVIREAIKELKDELAVLQPI